MLDKALNSIAIAILVIIGAPAGLVMGSFVWPFVLLSWAASRVQEQYGSVWVINWTDTLFMATVIVGIILTVGWWVFIGVVLTPIVWRTAEYRPS